VASRAHPIELTRLDPREWDRGILGAAAVSAAAGVAVAVYPVGAVALVWAVIVLAFAFRNLVATERLGALVLLGGVVTLGYGFSNVGLRLGPVPLPATEMLLIPLAALALADARTRARSNVLLPLCLFVGLVFIRLVFDYPNWGIFAIRDTTMAIEMFIVVIGYRAIARDGVEPWVRKLRLVFIVSVIIGCLEPWEGTIGQMGPQVGLQRPTPLFDFKGVKFSVVAGGLLFAVYAWPWIRPFLVGLVTGLIGIFQARTLYLMFPITILILAWASRRPTRILSRYIPAVAVGGMVLALAATLSIQGTEGEVSTEFLTQHVATLTGAEGTNAKTIDARQEFIGETLSFVAQSPGTVLVGVGLGPDLTFGKWVGDEGQLVRNPHNAYLEVYARTGLLGFCLFIWFLLACLIPMARRARRADGPNATFCAWALAACCVYLGVAAAQPILAFPYGAVPLFFFMGMGLAAAERTDYERPRLIPAPPPERFRRAAAARA
jgi:O-antigen ligase